MSDIIDEFEKKIRKALFLGYASRAMFCAKSKKVLDYKTVLAVTFENKSGKSAIQFFHTDERAVMIEDVGKNSKKLSGHGIKILFETYSDGEEVIVDYMNKEV